LTFEPFDTHWSNGIMARHAQDGRPLGHLHWHPHGEIDSITVHPDFQRMGVASAMLKHAQSDPATYEASYPIRHSNHFSSAGRAWAQSDPDYHDPGDQHVTKAEDNPADWGWTAVKQYTPAHVPYTGQNEAEMKPYLQVADQRAQNRTAALQGTPWPKKWRGHHPDVPWDTRWSPNHPEHVPNDMVLNAHRTAAVTMPYIRNNGGVRQWAGPDDYAQKVEPWGRYMSDGQYATGTPHPGWERGNVSFENPLYMPHNDGNWKHDLSQAHGGATGQALSDALIAKGHDGIVTHDKYGIGEMVDIRPKAERGHRVLQMAGLNGPYPEGLTFQHHPLGAAPFPDVIQPSEKVDPGAFPAISAHVGDQMVGHMQWIGDHPRKKGEIWDLRVHPDWQRRGVGTAMFDHVTDNIEPDLHHSPNLSDEGRAFAESEVARPLAQQRDEDWRAKRPLTRRDSF
jgi:ribosomal protein S18 acetylase RimI-like enzyme